MSGEEKKISWTTNISSGGTLEATLTGGGVPEEETRQISALARVLAEGVNIMRERGFISHELFPEEDSARMSERWERLLKSGGIPYEVLPPGRMRVHVWAPGYLGDEDKVSSYIANAKTVVRSVQKEGRQSGCVGCPVCREEEFEYAVNKYSSTNGICRSCGFHVHVTTIL